MVSLKESLIPIPAGRVALVDENISLTYNELSLFISDNINSVKNIKGSNVVICGRDKLEFVKLLYLLDGEVSRILFLPNDIDAKLHAKYYDDANINYEVYLVNDRLNYKTINEASGQFFGKTNWIVPTSGTTNIPKLVSHTFESLIRTSKINIESGKEYNWGLVYDIYRFSGIQVFLQSVISGSTLILPSQTTDISKLVQMLIGHSCNALSATPSFWRKIMMSNRSHDLDLKIITSGGEIADDNILSALKNRFKKARVIHIYASTEAGVGFSVTDGLAGFPRKYLDEGFNKTRLKISSGKTLMLKSEKQEQKYLSNDALYSDDGFVDTGDIVSVKSDRVYFLGRNSGAINVGGNKVQPEEVELILLNTGLINSAYVYSKDSPILGSIVCADVVLNDIDCEHRAARLHILDYCRNSLENYKVPAIIKFVEELETTKSGKLKRY